MPPRILLASLEALEILPDALGGWRIEQRRLVAIELDHRFIMAFQLRGFGRVKRHTVQQAGIALVKRRPDHRDVINEFKVRRLPRIEDRANQGDE